MHLHFRLEELAQLLQPVRRAGRTEAALTGLAPLARSQPGDVAFLAHRRHRDDLPRARASLLLLPLDESAYEPLADQAVFWLKDPSGAMSRICAQLEPELWTRPPPGIHPTAVVAPGASVAPSATVGPLCVVEEGAEVGERTILHARVHLGRASHIGSDSWILPGVVIYPHCRVGCRVRLHANVVLGADGFGYSQQGGRHVRVPQVGTVVIEDDVDLGAGTCVDRARFGRTVIGSGTKIDNLVQVGHNVEVGRNCLIVAQVGIGGTTTLGDYVVLGGQVGLADHLTIGAQARVAGQSGVGHDVPPGAAVMGAPAIPAMAEKRFAAVRDKLPELLRRVDRLEARFGAGAPPAPPPPSPSGESPA